MKLIKKLIKDYFLTGILVIGPLAVCYFVVKTIIDGADTALQTARWLPFNIPGLGFILAILIILLAGFLGRNFFGNYIINFTSDLVSRVPVLGGIYKSIKQIFETLFINTEQHFRRVVMIPAPSTGGKTLAFVTSENVPAEIQKLYSEPVMSVYLPTAPIPTNGFYIFIPKKDAQPTNLSVEEAFKIIVSLGLAVSDGH